MAVAVQMPREKKDPLTTIMQGLSIAKDIYGIKLDNEKMDMLRQKTQKDAELEAFQQSGGKTEAEAKEILMSGAAPATKDTPGAVSFKVGSPRQSTEQFFIPEKSVAAEKARVAAAQSFAKEQAKEGKKNADDLRTEFQSVVDKGGDASLLGTMRKARQITNLFNSDRKLTGADDIALINIFSRILSPGLVTTSDFDNAQRVGGYPEKVQAYVSQIKGDGELTDLQRGEILNSVEGMMQGAVGDFDVYVNQYEQLAKRRGVDVDDVISVEMRDLANNVKTGFEKSKERLFGGSAVAQQIKRRGIFDVMPGISDTAEAAPSDADALNAILRE